MHIFGTYILWALAAISLWQGSLAENARIYENLQSLEWKVERVERKLEGLQVKFENQLDRIMNQIEGVSKKLDAAKLEIPDLVRNSVPFGFERFDNRYFRISDELVNWDTAVQRCREMGGYLASIRNEKEILAIKEKLVESKGYWLGSNDRLNEGVYRSVASDRPAQFLIWRKGYPDDETHRQNCVVLQGGLMMDFNCSDHFRFICQMDNNS
ncbi:C-type lectin 37Db-like isoform X2 [Drosophila kikkawai]